MQPKGEAQSSIEAQKSLSNITAYCNYQNRYQNKYLNFNFDGFCIDCIKKLLVKFTFVSVHNNKKECLYCKDYKEISKSVSILIS